MVAPWRRGFAFTVTADAETAAKLGLKTDKDAYAVAAADDGAADLVDLIGGTAGSDVKFTDADAGKTYSFTVTETKLGGEGYANDTAPRTVTIAPAYDAATGRLHGHDRGCCGRRCRGRTQRGLHGR